MNLYSKVGCALILLASTIIASSILLLYSSANAHVRHLPSCCFDMPVSDILVEETDNVSSDIVYEKEKPEQVTVELDDEMQIFYQDNISGNDYLTQKYYRSRLTSSLIDVYDAIELGFRNFQTEIPIDRTSPNDLLVLIDYVLADNGDIFWCGNYFDYLSDDSGSVVSLLPEYKYSYSTAMSYQTSIDAIVSGVISSLPSSAGDYEKTYRLCDWLCSNTEYTTDVWTTQDIQSVFIDGVSTCAGYSHALQYLCNKAGVVCVYVYGTARNDSGNYGNHAWCKFNANGITYCCDPSWCDGGNTINDKWFGIDVSIFAVNHYDN